MPEDFLANDAGIEFAKKRGMTKPEYVDQIERFRDHWSSKSDKDGLKADWQAAWRTWVRNWSDWRSRNRSSNGHSPQQPNGVVRPRDPGVDLWKQAEKLAEEQGANIRTGEGMAVTNAIFQKMRNGLNGQENANGHHSISAA